MTPEHFKSLTPTPEQDTSLESQIKTLKQEGRTLLKETDTLIDQGEASTNPEERATLKQHAEDKIRELIKLKRKLRILTEEEIESSITPESYLTDLHPFLLETYKKWSYTEEQLKTVEKVISNPDNIHIGEDIPFESLKTQNKDETTRKANKSHTGELYLSSESIDYETTKPFIPEIPEDITKQGVSGVMKYIHDTYKDTHIIPDLTYYKYLTQLGDQYNTETDPIKKEAILSQIPEVFRDTSKHFYFPGSAFFNESGRWVCPCLGWSGAGFARNADGVEDGWDSNDRVVLLER
jgi:hypothetical protein